MIHLPWRGEHVPGGARQGLVLTIADGGGPPLLLLHGLAASARWWTRVLPALSAQHRVHAVDLPEFGASGHAVRFHLERVPEQLVALMDTLGLERAGLIGHSMGGLIAARLAADHPDRVDRLVLVDAGFLRLDPSWMHKVTGPIRAVRYTRPPLARLLLQDVARVGPIGLADATLQLLRTDWVGACPPSRHRPWWSGARATPSAHRSTDRGSWHGCRVPGWW